MTKINHRRFVFHAVISATGLLLGNSVMAIASKEKSLIPGTEIEKGNLMKEVMKYRKTDSHARVNMGV